MSFFRYKLKSISGKKLIFSICSFQGTNAVKLFVVRLNSAMLRLGHGHSPYKNQNNLLLTCKHDAKSFFDFCTPHCFRANGDGEIRTLDPLLARQVLSQLSYTPTTVFTAQCLYSLVFLCCYRQPPVTVGLNGLEPSTSRLSGVRSNQLSYKPIFNLAATYFPTPSPVQYHRPLWS